MIIDEKKRADIKYFCEAILEIIENNEEVKEINIRKPFDGDYKITQKFGENPAYYNQYGYKGHFGIDWATPWGTKILAIDDGIATREGFNTGNGNYIELTHSWGTSLYLHFKERSKIQIGQAVKKGEVIGYAGNTGAVMPRPTKDKPLQGTHLHFSMKILGQENKDYKNFIDPLPYL